MHSYNILNVPEGTNLSVGADPRVRPENSAELALLRADTGVCPYDPCLERGSYNA